MIEQLYVFLDANVLLHFRPPEQIDWSRLCGARRVDLVVYPLLRSEIANAKDMNPKKTLRARAGERERQLRGWLDAPGRPIRPDVFVHREGIEPRTLLDELGLDKQVRDDLIVAHAVDYRRRGREAAVATADGGLEMKLEDRGVRVVALPDEMRLPPEPDPEKQRADRAEAELRAIRNRLPTFAVETVAPVELTRQEGLGEVEGYVQRCLEETQAAYEEHQAARYGGRRPPNPDSIFHSRFQPGLEAAREYLRLRHRWLSRIEGAAPLQLVVKNTGSQVAANVRVSLSFPDGITPFGPGGFGTPPERRTLPGGFASLLPPDRADYDTEQMHAFWTPAEGAPTVLPGGLVRMTWERIAHHDRVTARRLWLTAASSVPLGRTGAQVSILCDEIGDAVEPYLQITVLGRACEVA